LKEIKVISEGRIKITLDVIKKAWAQRAKGTRIVIRDSDTAGLALIVNPQTHTWVFSYRPRGVDPVTKRRWPNKTVTLGNPSSLSIEDARHAAAALKGHAAAGGDPHADRKAKHAKELAARAATAARMLDLYEVALPLRPKLRGAGKPSAKHVAEEIAHARAAAEAMGLADVPLADITAAHLRKLLIAEAARPATARARFGAFSRFLDWAQDEGTITINPCVTIGRNRRPKPVPARAHYLSLAELALMWKGAAELEPIYRDLARFLPSLAGAARPFAWIGCTWILLAHHGRSPGQ